MKTMTVKTIRRRVREIEAIAPGDFEAAHAKEDQLFEDLLRFLAFGQYDPAQARELCFEALRAKTINFRRVCA